MAATQNITVNGTSPTAIVVQSRCRAIRITENRGVAGWPTSDFLIYKGAGPPPAAPTNWVRIQAGAQYTFNVPTADYAAGVTPNRVIGWVQMVNSGDVTTFDQDEDQVQAGAWAY